MTITAENKVGEIATEAPLAARVIDPAVYAEPQGV
jgi:hypothetical protein